MPIGAGEGEAEGMEGFNEVAEVREAVEFSRVEGMMEISGVTEVSVFERDEERSIGVSWAGGEVERERVDVFDGGIIWIFEVEEVGRLICVEDGEEMGWPRERRRI